jgi:4'-phosphopantetheinyl transferase EntD
LRSSPPWLNTIPAWHPTVLDSRRTNCLVGCVFSADLPAQAVGLLGTEEMRTAEGLPAWRRREWIAGRICLATSLTRLAAPREPLLARRSGAPVIPHGFVGSVSHSGTTAVAISASAEEGAIGIDLERVEAFDPRIAARALVETERLRLAAVEPEAVARYVSGVFSAKESVFKALAVEDRDLVDFENIDVELAPDLLRSDGRWHNAKTQLRGLKGNVEVDVRFDGDWVISIARRL